MEKEIKVNITMIDWNKISLMFDREMLAVSGDSAARMGRALIPLFLDASLETFTISLSIAYLPL